MFGIAAIVAFVVAWILLVASVAQGRVLTWQSFALIGLACLAAHVVTGWWPARRA